MVTQSRSSHIRRRRGLWELCAAWTLIAVIWCVVLPRLTRIESIGGHVEFLEERRIDASAMYYTELGQELFLGREQSTSRGQ